MSRRLMAGVGAWLFCCAAPAVGQVLSQPSLLPPTGTNVQLGNEFETYQHALQSGAPPPAAPGTPTLLIRPSIGLQEEYTSNVSPSGGGGSSDLITIFSPALNVVDDGDRLRANVNLAPSVYLYSRHPNQDRVGENAIGTAAVTLVPDLFYVDVRGLATEQAIGGGLGQSGSVTLSRQNTSQDYSLSIAPYLQHRFASWGSGEVGYAIARTDRSALGGVPAPLTSAEITQNVTTQNEHVGFTSGENFGRFSNATLLSGTQYDGSGVLSNAYRDIFSIDNGYAVDRNVILLGKVGYEDIHYSGTSPVHISDEIWSVGVRLTPNADSSITVRYGHQDGFNSLFVDASYAPTPRTRLLVRYSSGLTTTDEQLQNVLATSSVDASGQTIDEQTGAPLLVTSNFFGLQNSLYRLRSFSGTGVLQLDRDIISATVSNQDQTLISSASSAAVAIGTNNGTFGTVNWTRDITPRLSSGVFVEVGTRDFSAPVQRQEQLLAGGASLRYFFTETLFGTAQYNYNRTVNNIALGSTSQNLIFVSIRKFF